MWGNLKFISALRFRIEQKVAKAKGYDGTRYDDLRLLVVGQVPEIGGIASTYVVPSFIDLRELNESLHPLLLTSCFSTAYFFLFFDGMVYEWSRSEQWRIVRGPTEQRLLSRGPSFEEILRDPEWLCDPDAKARQEAEKAINSFRNKRKEAGTGEG
jgi:hypothetical protein